MVRVCGVRVAVKRHLAEVGQGEVREAGELDRWLARLDDPLGSGPFSGVGDGVVGVGLPTVGLAGVRQVHLVLAAALVGDRRVDLVTGLYLLVEVLRLVARHRLPERLVGLDAKPAQGDDSVLEQRGGVDVGVLRPLRSAGDAAEADPLMRPGIAVRRVGEQAVQVRDGPDGADRFVRPGGSDVAGVVVAVDWSEQCECVNTICYRACSSGQLNVNRDGVYPWSLVLVAPYEMGADSRIGLHVYCGVATVSPRDLKVKGTVRCVSVGVTDIGNGGVCADAGLEGELEVALCGRGSSAAHLPLASR